MDTMINLLLVEDVFIVSLATRFIIQEAGHVVDIAKNGREALELALNHPYDLILMDIGLDADMDGYQVTRIIRAQSKFNKNKPIIAFTAHSEKTVKQDCLLAGMNDIITKPLESESLALLIEQHVLKCRHFI